jgi:hypothetical protein
VEDTGATGRASIKQDMGDVVEGSSVDMLEHDAEHSAISFDVGNTFIA